MSSRVAWNEITAILGGRFDPPHAGHAEAIRGLFGAPGVGRVVVLPSAAPPHKPAQASFEDRSALCRVMVDEISARGAPGEIQVDEREERLARATPSSPTYSFGVIQDLKREYPKLAFVIGTDQLENFPTWHRFPEILGLCHWIVLARQPVDSERAGKAFRHLEESGLISRTSKAPAHLGDWLVRSSGGSQTVMAWVPTPAPAVSSTAIREVLARTGDAPQNSLPVQVAAELKRRRIYGTKAPRPN